MEVLEAAFRRAVGLAYTPWQARDLFLPEVVVAPFVGLGRLVGVRGTFGLVLCATAPFILLASVNVVLVYAIARRWLSDTWAARWVAALYAFHWLPLSFGSTPYPRTASTTLVLAATLALSLGGGLVAGGAAGAAIGLAFAVRHSEGMYLLPVLVIAAAAGSGRGRPWRRVLAVLGGFAAAAALAVGLYDLVTWGRPFASFVEVFRFTVIEGRSTSALAVKPATFYLARILFWVPLPLVPALFYAARVRAVRPAWTFLAVPLLVLSLIQFKQLRYLQGAVPFLVILGTAGFLAMRRRVRPWVVNALAALSLVAGVLGVRELRGKSMAAVTAARAIATEPGVRAVALSQAWAYGDRLYFGNRIDVRDLPTPPTAADLESAARSADRIAVYLLDLQGDPALAAALARRGFRESRTFAWGESESVVVFSRE